MVAFLIPIFGNVDGSWRVTSKLRGSTLIQVARRRSKVFQRVSASLVRVGDVQGVSRRHAVRGKKIHTLCVFWGGVEKVEKFIEGRGDEAAQRDLCLLSLFHRMECKSKQG